HTRANGGNGNNERFGTPDLLTYRLGMRGPETCSTYNMLKLARELFCTEGDMQYLDYYENALFNHILGTLSTKEGEGVCYHTSLKPGTFKCYDDLYNSFWCCVGTGMESHVKYNDALFFHNDNDLLAAIYTPSYLTWEEKGLQLKVTTKYPTNSLITMTVTKAGTFDGAIVLRYPTWAAADALTVNINGETVKHSTRPGDFLRLQADWKDGDVVQIHLRPDFRLVDLPDDVHVSALFYGPIMLGTEEGSVGQNYVGINAPDKDITNPVPDYYFPSLPLKRSELGNHLKQKTAGQLVFTTEGLDKTYTFKPFYDIHDCRYNVYYKYDHPDDLAAERAIIADHVIPGDPASETAHGCAYQQSGTGYGGFAVWGPAYFGYRDATAAGYFSYDMQLFETPLADDQCYYLQVTYFGDEPEDYGNFRITVDGRIAASVGSIGKLARLDFAQRYYMLPRSMTDGKKKITVKFSGGKCSVYGLRLLRTDHLPSAIESLHDKDARQADAGPSIHLQSGRLHAQGEGNVTLSIHSVSGMTLGQVDEPGHSALDFLAPRGVYIVRASDQTGTTQTKIIKQ
ncbi:MAG: glycoside hydrolase family 127 protein, partial [Bacteroidaceae bacterium]|nr:glycoside hydrolase family 127 protein [Bacteroidaceae bacterium]